MDKRPLKIVYVTPALYMAGGVERVLTLKANYFAEHYGYDITIILTEGKDKPLFYPLSDKIKVVNLDIGFEKLWSCSFAKKVFIYLSKQYRFKRLLTAELMHIRPNITISLLRREINFLNEIKDGSRKIGELHVNRSNYRNFEVHDSNIIKKFFARFWMRGLVSQLKKLDQFVVLTEEDRNAWPELCNIKVIPDPLTFTPIQVSSLQKKRLIAVGRYVYQKGFDLLLQVWSKIERQFPDWELAIFGDGERFEYERQMQELAIDSSRCHLNGPTSDIQREYINSSLFAFSSRFEGFGMVLVEAMACGLPVVSFSCPCGPQDIIRDGEDGVLVKNGDIDAFANSLSWLMQNPELRVKMAQAGLKNVQRFSIEHIAEQWRSVFESLNANAS